MAKTYVSEGNVLQHTAAADISSGDVVIMSGTMGVALGDIASGETGSVQIGGVFRLPKATAADITQGDTLTYVAASSEFDDSSATPASGDVTGPCAIAALSAGAGATTVDVLLTGVPGTVTP